MGLGDIQLARYQVSLEARAPLSLPRYLGSTLRGAFGHAFRNVACSASVGQACPDPHQCPYHLVFETSPPPDAPALSTFDDVPRPFVIAPPPGHAESYPAGSTVRFDLTLIGQARQLFAYFVVALREVRGLGRGRREVELSALHASHPLHGGSVEVYRREDRLVRPRDFPVSLADCAALPAPSRARVQFLTPTRLKYEDQWARRPVFHVVFRRLIGRLSSMAVFHCGTRLDLDFRGLIEAARHVRLVSDSTRWQSWDRYSSRQDRRMDLGGLTGEAVYEGDLRPFWPFLMFGQWTHVGKNATFGLGRYQIAEDRRGAA